MISANITCHPISDTKRAGLSSKEGTSSARPCMSSSGLTSTDGRITY